MAAYCVSYDLKVPGKNYGPLYEELKKSPNWWHYLDSTWLISTRETAAQLAARLRRHIDGNDYVLVIEVRNNSDGWLPKEAWDWIKQFVPA
jgi:hypothetical protein